MLENAIAIGAAAVAFCWRLLVITCSEELAQAILGNAWTVTQPPVPYVTGLNVIRGVGFGVFKLLRAMSAIRETFRMRVACAAATFILGGLAATRGTISAASAAAAFALLSVAMWRNAWKLTRRSESDPPRVPLSLSEARQLAEEGVASFPRVEPEVGEHVPVLSAKSAESNGRVPDVFVIGAMRAGTTGFCADLGGHPRISLPQAKEPWVLVRCRGDATLARHMYHEFYRDVLVDGQLVDGSTSYSMRPAYPCVAHDAYRLAPHAKIIYLVRNPVDRAISHFRHLVAWGVAPASDFDTAFGADSRFVDIGRYWWQLQPWLDVFGASVRVIRFEDYRNDRAGVVKQAVGFLGLDPTGVQIEDDVVLNQSAQARAVSRNWLRFLYSGMYERRIRPRIPQEARNWMKDRLLPPAPAVPDGPSLAAVNHIIECCEQDSAQLAKFLGLEGPLWDWDATRQRLVTSLA